MSFLSHISAITEAIDVFIASRNKRAALRWGLVGAMFGASAALIYGVCANAPSPASLGLMGAMLFGWIGAFAGAMVPRRLDNASDAPDATLPFDRDRHDRSRPVIDGPTPVVPAKTRCANCHKLVDQSEGAYRTVAPLHAWRGRGVFICSSCMRRRILFWPIFIIIFIAVLAIFTIVYVETL